MILPLLISLTSYAFLFWQGHEDFDISYDYGFIRCVASFFLGIVLFRLKHRILNGIKPSYLSICEYISVVMVVVGVHHTQTLDAWLVFTLISFAWCLVVFSSKENGFLGKFLEKTFMINTGTWSYSIYMNHALILAIAYNAYGFLYKNDASSLGFISVVINVALLLVTIFVSKYTYYFIEKIPRDNIRRGKPVIVKS